MFTRHNIQSQWLAAANRADRPPTFVSAAQTARPKSFTLIPDSFAPSHTVLSLSRFPKGQNSHYRSALKSPVNRASTLHLPAPEANFVPSAAVFTSPQPPQNPKTYAVRNGQDSQRR
jgi:hypothetical protein